MMQSGFFVVYRGCGYGSFETIELAKEKSAQLINRDGDRFSAYIKTGEVEIEDRKLRRCNLQTVSIEPSDRPHSP